MRQWIFVVIFCVSACGSNQAAALLPNGTILWRDVPAFNGSAPDVNTTMLINQAPPDMSTMELYTNQDITTVAAFYSNDLMKQYAWSPQPYDIVKHFSVGEGQGPQIPTGETAGGCDSNFKFHDKPAISCTFSKTDSSGHHSELDISIITDSDNHQTEIDYTRFESNESGTKTP